MSYQSKTIQEDKIKIANFDCDIILFLTTYVLYCHNSIVRLYIKLSFGIK